MIGILNIKSYDNLTLTTFPNEAGHTAADECVGAILTGAAILTRHASTVVGFDCTKYTYN